MDDLHPLSDHERAKRPGVACLPGQAEGARGPGEKASALLMFLPERVARRYQEALLVQAISPTACAMLIGSTLEAICAQERIPGTTLTEKLVILAQRRHLPPLFLEIAQYLRSLRNIGSHEIEEDITLEDVPAMLAALEALLDYLYVLPLKIKVLEGRLQHHTDEKKKKAEEKCREGLRPKAGEGEEKTPW